MTNLSNNTPEQRDPEDWYLYSGAGAYQFMVTLHSMDITPERRVEMMRNYGRRFVEDADLEPIRDDDEVTE